MVSNRNALKKYAPRARLDFIQEMTNRAAIFGITESGVVDGVVQGELFILSGKAYPRSVAAQRDRLARRIQRDGFDQVMDAIAYTWFNRLLAIRYMEVHDYFDHGLRVLSHPAGHDEPQILEQATTLGLPGLNREEIVTLKLDGTKDEDIYRKVLITQCNDLHRALPFLFERIDDETELLLPNNLLQSDSIVRKLVNEIEESEWNEIEIIGWLYQFYISEKKDQVMGKVVKSEDIPTATQLFTPNWIVKYMVQNSLGAQWLATYPESPIRGEMEYYIAPAQQTPEVQAQLAALTPKQLDPEAITLIDPAVGSGHILVEAYDLFRAIYLERGYTKREAARAILAKNLFGLDIDDRAAQMAGFALLMKACADDRSVLSNPPALNVLALQDSGGLDADALAKALLPQQRFEMVPNGDLLPETLAQPTLAAQQPTSAESRAIKPLVTLFDGAKTFGSLITVPGSVTQNLPLLDALLARPLTSDLLLRQAQEDAQETLRPLVEQARLLGGRYHCVVANPPYMGGKGMNADLKAFAGKRYPDSKSNLFAAFIERGFEFIGDFGRHSMVTMQSWMFLPSFEKLRRRLLGSATLEAMAHMGNGVMGIAFGTAATNFRNAHFKDSKGVFCWVENDDISSYKPEIWPPENERNSKAGSDGFFRASASDFEKIPGSPIAYWASPKVFKSYEANTRLGENIYNQPGLQTSNNNLFVRRWQEVSYLSIGIGMSPDDAKKSNTPWFPYLKGGEFRKWYGNNEHVVLWKNGGEKIKKYISEKYPYLNGNIDYVIKDRGYYFSPLISYNAITSSIFSARISGSGFLFDVAGSSLFPSESERKKILGFMCSSVGRLFLKVQNPTLNIQSSDIQNLPIATVALDELHSEIEKTVNALINYAESDWDAYEISWNFVALPLLVDKHFQPTLQSSFDAVATDWQRQVKEMKRLENENNRLFIEAYGLQDEITPTVPLSEITLTCNPHYRYGGDLTDAEREARLKSDTMRELVSYAIGCMMGRYSLTEPGLIYAHSGNVGFDPSRYGAFPADDDGILPLTEEQWFADDVAVRVEEFLGVAWPESPVVETMTRMMDGLAMGTADEPRTALRAYLSKQFYKDHLQTYKNRPIYWLFSSGKQKAFEALVYLHRYNEGTLARMRTNHVSPLMGKLQQRMNDLASDIASSASSAEKARKAKEKDKLGKQLTELRAFDEELRHLADQRIALDLDDGVKVNYGRFGNLLAAKDKVCGKAE